RSRNVAGVQTCALPIWDSEKARLQDFGFVRDRMTPSGRDPRSVDLAGRLRDLPGQCHAARCRQQVRCTPAWHFALEPYLEFGDGADWLGDRDPIGTVCLKPGLPERVEEPIAVLTRPSRPDLADQHDRLQASVRSLHVDVVFDHAAASGLVPGDADRLQM